MDGGGRLLRALGDFGGKLADLPPSLASVPFIQPQLAFAGGHHHRAFPVLPQAAPRLPRWRRRRSRLVRSLLDKAAHSRFLGTLLVLGLLGGSAAYGAVRGGAYDEFIAANGVFTDALARMCGFPIKAVTIAGAHELHEAELLKLAGVGPTSSLLFLNVAAIRTRLKAVPLIKEASVSKLYPDRLLFEIEERVPYALWQKDGVVSLVAADGMPIDDMHDARCERLPLVVGAGANEKLAEFIGILDSAGELRERVRAGIYVSGRRWTLKMENGVEVDLPESGPAQAVSRFALLEHDGHILEKDIISADLRIPGRVVIRLTAEAAANRDAAVAAKTKKKGAAT